MSIRRIRRARRGNGGRRSLARGSGLRLVMELDGLSRADIESALVHLVHISTANDMRHDSEDDFIFRMILRGLTKEILEDRNLRQSRNAGQRLGLLVFHDAAEQVGFAVFQADFMLDLALADDGLADAADVLLASDSGDVHRNLQRDFAVGVDARRDVDVDTDVKILELSVDQRVDADTADARLE